MDKILELIIQQSNEIVVKAVEKSFEETKKEVIAQKKKQFDNDGANDWDKEQFPELQESTKRIKKQGGYPYPDKPLYRSGKLKDSIREGGAPYSFDVETDISYATDMDAWLRAKGSQHSFKELSDKEMDAAVDEFIDILAKEVSNGAS